MVALGILDSAKTFSITTAEFLKLCNNYRFDDLLINFSGQGLKETLDKNSVCAFWLSIDTLAYCSKEPVYHCSRFRCVLLR